jgi:hypothetical protein
MASSQNALQATKAEYAEQKARVEEPKKSSAQNKDAPVSKCRPSTVKPFALPSSDRTLMASASTDGTAGQICEGRSTRLPDELQRARQVRSRIRGIRSQDMALMIPR